MIKKIKSFIKLKNKFLFVKAYVLCGYYRLAIIFIPFNKLAKKMGILGIETPNIINEDMVGYIYSVRNVVTIASKNTPWESLCMVQALSAQRLLNKKMIDSTIYFGLSKDENNAPIAHAWLKHGGKVVVGEVGMEKFSVIAKFGSLFN